MKIESKKISTLKPMKNNVRRHSEEQIAELVKSVKLFGQIRPVVIDEKNNILAGHGLVKAVESMGEESVNVYVVKGLTRAQKNKLVLADNKIYEMGINDYDAMNAIFDELRLDEELIDIPGFDDLILTNLFGDEEETDELISEYGNVSPETTEVLQEKAEQVVKRINEPEKEKEFLLSNDVVKVQEAPNERPRPYVLCPECGEKIWL